MSMIQFPSIQMTDLFDQTEKGGVEKVENQRTTDGTLYQEGLHFVRA